MWLTFSYVRLFNFYFFIFFIYFQSINDHIPIWGCVKTCVSARKNRKLTWFFLSIYVEQNEIQPTIHSPSHCLSLPPLSHTWVNDWLNTFLVFSVILQEWERKKARNFNIRNFIPLAFFFFFSFVCFILLFEIRLWIFNLPIISGKERRKTRRMEWNYIE